MERFSYKRGCGVRDVRTRIEAFKNRAGFGLLVTKRYLKQLYH